ncbi:MAG: hypothetical protein ACI4EF_10410 [Coprococcus sp.]
MRMETDMDNVNKESEKTQNQKKSGWRIAVYVVCSIIIAIAIIMLIMYIVISRHGKKEIQSVADGFISGLNDRSNTKLYELFSDEYIDYLSRENGFSKADAINMLDDDIDYFMDDLESEAGYDIGSFHEIRVFESNIENYSGDEFQEMSDYFKDEFDILIDDYAEADLKCNVTGDKRNMQLLIELYIYKIGDKWYLLDWYWVGLEG